MSDPEKIYLAINKINNQKRGQTPIKTDKDSIC
jgi:hypothetical protein